MTAETTRESGDPLGLRVWAASIASGLAPGLTNSTTNLRGYGLLCAGLECASQKKAEPLGPDEAWLRFERLWVLAQTAYAQNDPSGVATWRGRNEAARLLEVDENAAVRLDVPLLGHQMSTGSWGAYRRSAQLMGLLQPAPYARGTTPLGTMRSTSFGYPLSARWRADNMPSATSIDVAKILASGQTTKAEAMWVFAPDRRPSGPRATAYKAMTHVIRDSISAGPRLSLGQSLHGLRSVWNEAGSLSPAQLHKHRDRLNARQLDYVPQARALLWLFHHVEKPFREYLRTGSGHPEHGIWDSSMWRIAEAYSPEALSLLTHGRRTGAKSWAGTQQWATELAARRGREATQPGYAPTGYDTVRPPAMSLHAAEALFAEGFLGPRTVDNALSRKTRRRAARSDDE